MILSLPNLDISFTKDNGTKTLVFLFRDKFTNDASIKAIRAWTETLEAYPEEQFYMVWDCKDMNGFEVAARKEWYNALMKYKANIAKVTVLSRSLIVRGAARVMLSHFDIDAEIIKPDVIPATLMAV